MKNFRILHFSDVHLPYPPGAWLAPAMLHPKRILAFLNYLLRRRHHYTAAFEKLAALHAFLDAHPVDFIFYTGDSVNSGLELEYAAAAPRIRALLTRAPRFLAVPGNHDLYTPASITSYKRHFAFAESTRPSVVPLNENAAAIPLSSALPHFPFWDSSGRTPTAELETLKTLLRRPDLARCPNVFLLLHYPPTRGFCHGFQSADALANVLANYPNVIIVHGHQHRRNFRTLPRGQRVFCAGSLTSSGKAGFWHYELDGPVLIPTPYHYASAAFYPEAT